MANIKSLVVNVSFRILVLRLSSFVVKNKEKKATRETEQYLYNFLPLIQAMSNSPELIHKISFSHKPIVLCLRTSMYRHEPQGLTLICLCIFVFTLKYSVPIDRTDRLQRFDLKIFVCVLRKKQSHLRLGCPRGKHKTSTFSIFG